MRTTSMLLATALLFHVTPCLVAQSLPGTALLELEGSIPDQLMDGAHRYIDRKIDASVKAREQYWKRDTASKEAYDSSVQPNRARFARSLGVVDLRLPPDLEIFGSDDQPALVAETEGYRVFQVRWPVLEDVSRITGEGLLLRPKSKPRAYVVAIPDAVWTPEDIAGLTDRVPVESQYARRLVENGFEVVVPTVLSRSTEFSTNLRIRPQGTGKTHREWVYHMAFHMGRHVIGYEVERVLSAVDWMEKASGGGTPIGVVGRGEGGLLALYAAAIDTRIDATLVSGYFQSRQKVWREPIYRNVWGILREFGDAELATLVAPRGLVVEHSPVAERVGQRAEKRPQELAANEWRVAGGEILTPTFNDVAGEFSRIGTLLPDGFQARGLVHGVDGATVPCGSPPALARFADFLGVDSTWLAAGQPATDRRSGFDPRQRERRQVKELENHVQWLLRNADATRDEFVLRHVEGKSLDEFADVVRERDYRGTFNEEVLGKIDDVRLPPQPRSRKVYDRPLWSGYEVTLDVFPDVIAYGILLVPKDLQLGERRPVVVCQHGRNGIPRDAVEGDVRYYHDFAAQLADRGFVTFSPHNLYRNEQRYRWLDRKANGVKLSMFSFIVSQHEQILDWLETLAFVDPKRIAFYGLSYGGETAIRVPPLLEKYCLSICSADFNDWARRVADSHSRYGYPFYDEWEMPYFNMGSTFNYAELAYLMVPRPFMVERGHWDGVGPDEWVAYEFAKVKRLYDELGLGERAQMEVFTGPHTINAQATFEFLHRHLNWPRPGEPGGRAPSVTRRELDWQELAAIPDPEGFGGGYVGVSHGALLFAGGANFPDKPVWEGGGKRYYDSIFLLDRPDGTWRRLRARLPRPMAYGGSVTHGNRLIIIGGEDSERAYADVFALELDGDDVKQTQLASLPRPCTYPSVARAGVRVFVAGGVDASPWGADATNYRAFWSLRLSKTDATWLEHRPWPGPERFEAVAAGVGDSFFLFSGMRKVRNSLVDSAAGSTTNLLRDAYRYTVTGAAGDGHWHRIASPPRGAAGAASPAPSIDGAGFLLIGGWDAEAVRLGNRGTALLAEHPGVNRSCFAYDITTDTWSAVAPFPDVEMGRVTIPTTLWGRRWILASGERRPGVRSPRVFGIEFDEPR
jgi:dienelactone hydrolase